MSWSFHNREPIQRAFTLVELLVATTVTLLLVLALAQAFSVVSGTVSNNRAMLELAGQLRGTTVRLQADMDAIPSPVLPFQASGAARGFVEYRDGAAHDLSGDSSRGDYDDYLMFTAESTDVPFSGRFTLAPTNATFNSTLLYSRQAEVAWWSHLLDRDGDNVLDADESLIVYRRARLIRPDLNGVAGFFLKLPLNQPTYDTSSQTDLRLLFDDLRAVNNEIDVSWRAVRVHNGSNLTLYLVANSMSDLTFRQNRFAHEILVTVDNLSTPSTFTYNPQSVSPPAPYAFVPTFDWTWFRYFTKTDDRIGDDVMLSNVLAWDVRAFDPLAAVSVHPGEDGAWGVQGYDDDGNGTVDDLPEAGWVDSDDEAVAPGDRSYGSAVTGTAPNQQLIWLTRGAFVDLNYLGKGGLSANVIPPSTFRTSGGSTGSAVSIGAPLYDTWALDYESDGYDEDGDGTIDEAVDGLDSNSGSGLVYGADDALERETVPPYNVDLRGLQVRLRVIDPDSRQVRQSTVASDYTTE